VLLLVEALLVEALLVEALLVEALLVEALLVEALLVEALLVEALLVEALLVEALLVEAPPSSGVFSHGSPFWNWLWTLLTKSGPLTVSRKLQRENQRACSCHGSSCGSQLRRAPSQQKHLTWSPVPM